MPWTTSWEGPIDFEGFCVGQEQGIVSGGFNQGTVMHSSQVEGYRFFGGGGPLAFGAFVAIRTSHGIPSLCPC